MNITFQKDGWSMDGLVWAGSARFAPMPPMEQREDFIENIPCEASNDGYAYISLVTEEKVQPGVKLTTRCAFEDRAAPLVVLPQKLVEKDGSLFYSDYLEVVLWVNGINVWNLWADETGKVQIRPFVSCFFAASSFLSSASISWSITIAKPTAGSFLPK